MKMTWSFSFTTICTISQFEVNYVANQWGWLQPEDIQSNSYKDAEIFDLDVHYNAISKNNSSTHLKRKKSSGVQSTITGVPTIGVIGDKILI